MKVYLAAMTILLAGCSRVPTTELAIVTHTETTTVTAQPAATSSTDGVFLIGQDMQPGTYHSAGPVDPRRQCGWKRLKDTSGTSDAIIAWNFMSGPQVVTISPTDAAFYTQNCQPWISQ